jgi:Neuraminidase (sialidase)
MASTFPTLDISKPDATTQTLTQMGQSTRDMLTFLRAAVVSGTLFGYNGTPSGGTASQPAQILYAKGVEQIKEVITWGTIGGAAGNPQAIVYSYSNDTGATWAAIGTLTYSFDSTGNVINWTWS